MATHPNDGMQRQANGMEYGMAFPRPPQFSAEWAQRLLWPALKP